MRAPHYADASVRIFHGDCLDVLRELPDASVDSVVTDPPYGLANTDPVHVAETIIRWVNGERDYLPGGAGFMGKAWDAFVPPVAVWDDCLRVLKPGGHVLAFAGSRTVDLMTLGLRLAGFEIRDSIAWLYGSGFPKSLDVSKAIDKAAGAEREFIGERTYAHGGPVRSRSNMGAVGDSWRWGDEWHRWEDLPASAVAFYEKTSNRQDTAPATPDAERWQGWGTALKPAFEPVVVARKPLAGTVAANVTTFGTGALNIDGCRIGREDGDRTEYGRDRHLPHANTTASLGKFAEVTPYNPHDAGRWPANVVLDESQAAELDQQSGILSAGGSHDSRGRKHGIYGARDSERSDTFTTYDDPGGASRFFYVARWDEDGQRWHLPIDALEQRFYYTAKADASERPRVDGIAHPTVKPLALMRWLVRLVTPPGGTVLEPFAGSGTTVEACIVEGFQCIAIEREADYLPLIEARVARRRDPVRAIELAGEDAGLFALLDEEPA